MPKGDSTNALRRQWTLLKRIPRHPQRKSATELRQALADEGIKVEKRTIERDLNDLAEIFPIECDDRNKPYGWYWIKDVFLDVPGMTPAEALAFQMIEQFVKPLLPGSILESLDPYLRTAVKTLNSSAGAAASWKNKIAVVHPTQLLIPPTINPAVHRSVTEGLLLDRQLEIVYRKRGKSELVTHTVNPLALVQRGPVTYLVVNQSKAPFYLAMHRISKVGVLQGAAQRPAGFDLDEHIASGRMGFGDGKKIRLEALFAAEAAEHLEESKLSQDQTLTGSAHGRVKVVATVPHNQQLEWWLLGFGDQVEVKNPSSLRLRVSQTATRMTGKYRYGRN